LPGDIVGLTEGGGSRPDQADTLRHRRDRRQDHQRIEHRLAPPAAIKAHRVRQKYSIEQAPFGDARQLLVVSNAEFAAAQGIGLVPGLLMRARTVGVEIQLIFLWGICGSPIKLPRRKSA